jgi:hypothetical protein
MQQRVARAAGKLEQQLENSPAQPSSADATCLMINLLNQGLNETCCY